MAGRAGTGSSPMVGGRSSPMVGRVGGATPAPSSSSATLPKRFKVSTKVSLSCAGVVASPAPVASVPSSPLCRKRVTTTTSSSSLLRQASDSGVSITSGDEETTTASGSSSPDGASNCSVIELTSAKLKELDEYNRTILAQLAAQTLGDNNSSCSSLLEAAKAEQVSPEAFDQIKEDINWKTAWKELAGVTPSRRLLQLMRRLQAKWSGESSSNPLSHVTLTRASEGSSGRPFLKGSALLDGTQRVAVASPSGALVASRGGQVRSYVNTGNLRALRQDLIDNTRKTNADQENDLVCLTTDSTNQKWQTIDVNNMTHQREETNAPLRPNRSKARAPLGPNMGQRNRMQVDPNLPPSPQLGRRQPPSPQMSRRIAPSPVMSRKQAPPSPQTARRQPASPLTTRGRPPSPLTPQMIQRQVPGSQSIRGQPASPATPRRQSIVSQSNGTQVIRVQPPPSPRSQHISARSQPPSPSTQRRNVPSPLGDRRASYTSPLPPRSRDTSASRDPFRSPGLPVCGGPREQMAPPPRGRCPQARSALHNPRTARSQTRGDAHKPTLRGSSQPPVHHRDAGHLNVSSRLRDDVLAAFGVKLNSRNVPQRNNKQHAVLKSASAARVDVPVNPYQYEEDRKLSLDSNSSGISGCSQDSLNIPNDPFYDSYCPQAEVVSAGMGFSPHAHLHVQQHSPEPESYTVLSERSSSPQEVHHPNKRRITSSRVSSLRPRKSAAPECGLSSDCNTVSSCGSSDSNKENKKHRSRVHLGGDNNSTSPLIANNDPPRNNIKPIKATTISINLGPIGPLENTTRLSKKSATAASRQQTASSKRPAPKRSSPSRKHSSQERKISESKASRNVINSRTRTPRESIDNDKWNGCNKVASANGNRALRTALQDRQLRTCPPVRDNIRPVSRLVRKGTFRINETRGVNGQDIAPSVRLRYLMQRAHSGEDSSSQPDTSPPSSIYSSTHNTKLQVK